MYGLYIGGLCFDKFRNCPHASDHSMNRYKQILNNLVNDQINWARYKIYLII